MARKPKRVKKRTQMKIYWPLKLRKMEMKMVKIRKTRLNQFL